MRVRRHRIEIQRRVVLGANSVGELVYTWELLCFAWAQVDDGWASMRFHPGVGIGQRVIAGGKVFEIKNITELPSRHPLLKLEFNYSDAAENAPRAAKVQRFSALP